MKITDKDIKQIIDFVGREGTIYALEKSDKINSKELLIFAKSIGLSPKTKDSKKTISSQIVQKIDMRIDKPLDDLKLMSKEDLVDYFQKIDCHQDELVELLKNIDLKAQVKTTKALIEFAAMQISSLGIYERLSTGNGKTSKQEKGSFSEQ